MAISRNLPAETGDIVAYRGDTFQRWVSIKRNGQFENHTGSNFRMQIKEGNKLVTELSTSSGHIAIAAANTGVLLLAMSAAEMDAAKAGRYVYDFQQTYPDGKVVTRFKGVFEIVEDITKPL